MTRFATKGEMQIVVCQFVLGWLDPITKRVCNRDAVTAMIKQDDWGAFVLRCDIHPMDMVDNTAEANTWYSVRIQDAEQMQLLMAACETLYKESYEAENEYTGEDVRCLNHARNLLARKAGQIVKVE